MHETTGPASGSTTAPATVPSSSRVLTVPNLISFVRLAMVPLFLVLVVRGDDLWALGVLVLAGVSDWADGYIARRFGQTSDLGRALDPAADRLYIAAAVGGLAWRELIPWWLVGILVLREVVVAATLPGLLRRGYGPLPVHLVGKAGTALLMYAFPLLLLAGVAGVVGTLAWTVGWAVAIWGVALYWLAGVLYLVQYRRVLRLHDGPT